MADQPMIFAMANPDPEIKYELAKAARPDALVATGRSDYPNQINNVLGFPFIFRGALDVRARAINEEMKIAAARSLAALAHEDVPDVGAERLRAELAGLRPRLPDPQAARPARAAVGGAGRGRGRHAQRRGAPGDRAGRISRATGRPAGPGPARAARHHQQGPGPAQAHRLRRRRASKIIRAAAQIVEEGIGQPILLGRRGGHCAIGGRTWGCASRPKCSTRPPTRTWPHMPMPTSDCASARASRASTPSSACASRICLA